ncbi:signal peptide peptidase SppA [Mangrovimicrobium sediminis]|uniref:Signal peptide peptidase SppA n=1 Tax=Mangrovimicrobium sediminis TaxID=2562682 RepID=A0A4Z0LXW0_9GAMM|nr:signal peptide peptidase SppA [Haliea sp. SAOS-164]TGD72064.1 signal peptide peptidase SppA [Haliea sp. SAOS-164]
MSDTSPIRRFFAALWRGITWLRLALANILFLVMLVVFYFVFVGRAPEPLPAKAALLLNPVGVVVDQRAPVEPLAALAGEPDPAQNEVLLRDILEAIDTAREDDKIDALVMELDYLMYVGISRTQEISAALQAFRDAGKRIVAVGDYYTQDQYLLASFADEIIMHPLGGLGLEGFSVYQNYYADALDKLSVNMHVFRAGKHKSAVEPFLRNDMSPDEKVITRTWLDDLWSEYTGTVERNRELPAGAVGEFIEGMPARLTGGDGDQAVDALQAKLVDHLMSRIEANAYLTEIVGAQNEDGLYEAVPFEEYLWHKRVTHLPQEEDARIAVITAQGAMLPGEQPPGTIGGDSLAWLIGDAVADEGIKAIVLRVNSPGGSMFAAEVIREQVADARAAGIPVVVSMGAMAASGGYYIAAEADQIWATPTTITGSIGVFAAFPTVEDLLQRVGVHTDGVGTTSMAGSLRLDRPLNPALEAAVQAGVGHAYSIFRKVVAEGRDMSLEAVDSVAEGRVWSAADALDVGLVDALGSLDDAVAAAAELAGLESYEVDYFEESLTPSQLLVQQLAKMLGSQLGAVVDTRSDRVAALVAMARPLLDAAQLVDSLQDPRHLYLRCLACGAVQ